MRNCLSFLKQKPNSTKIKILVKSVVLILVIGITFVYKEQLSLQPMPTTSLAQENSADTEQNAALADITQKETYAGLPVSDLKYFPTDNAKGTAILVPQYHREMGTDPLSKTNEGAITCQQEVYQVLSFLLDHTPLNLMMEEGEIYGPVPEDQEIKDSKEQMNLLSNLSFVAENLKNNQDADSMQGLPLKNYLQNTNDLIDKLRKKSIIEGAPFTLKAEGRNFNLIGAESQQSYDESGDVMRENIDLENRLNELTGKSATYRTWDKNNTNPFDSITDAKKIETMLDESDKKVDEIVINKRNQDVAANFSRALDDYHTNLGLIEFGASHEDGLVKELQNQGVNVVVITTNEVAKK